MSRAADGAPDAVLPVASTQTEVFSRPVVKLFLALPAAIYGLILLSGIMVPSTTWWEKLLLGLALAALILVMARVARLAVVAEPAGLVIKNLRNTHRIPWSDIETITEPGPIPVAVYRENALARRDMKLQVVLHDGTVIAATIYDQRMVREGYGQAGKWRRAAIARLNQLRLERS